MKQSLKIWFPCSQMKDYEKLKPLEIVGAKGSYLELSDGHKIIDAISSWWCKSLGHGHPKLKEALIKQANNFEHVIQAGTINKPILELSEKLSGFTKNLSKVFYASDGSTAVEIALKISLHSRKILGQNQKTKFIALKNSYHGETAGAMSVSDLQLYKKPYQEILFHTNFLPFIPYVNTTQDPLWTDSSLYWIKAEKFLNQYTQELTAIIIEPIVQGASGMNIYSQDFLKRLRAWTIKNNVHLIADEIMTGFGRTGKMFACNYADIEPDFLCLGKALTSGWLPMSAVLTTNDIYQIFYDDYENGNNFLHSNTFSGNPLSASVALETLNIIQQESLYERANEIGNLMYNMMKNIAQSTNKLTNIRNIGAIVAGDLISDNKRAGFEVYKKAISLGAFLRPLGNTIYWLPPINISEKTLGELQEITAQAVCCVS